MKEKLIAFVVTLSYILGVGNATTFETGSPEHSPTSKQSSPTAETSVLDNIKALLGSLPISARKSLFREYVDTATSSDDPKTVPIGKLDAADIANRVNAEFKKIQPVLTELVGKDIVVFLGNTKAGKSTLINMLANIKLELDETGDFVLSKPEPKEAMPIGINSDSKTRYPKSIKLNIQNQELDKLYLADLPGLNDTDGSVLNLINTAFIKKVLHAANSVRFVFVASMDEFVTGGGALAVSFLDSLKGLFNLSDLSAESLNEHLLLKSTFVVTRSTKENINVALAHCAKKIGGARIPGNYPALVDLWLPRAEQIRTPQTNWEENNQQSKTKIYQLIMSSQSVCFSDPNTPELNVSLLYPEDTRKPLVGMFIDVMEKDLETLFKKELNSITDYDNEVGYFSSEEFWGDFNEKVLAKNEIKLLEEFCKNQYEEAKNKFYADNEEKKNAHIKELRDKKIERSAYVKSQTGIIAEGVIKRVAPKLESGQPITFDFAYHQDIKKRFDSDKAVKEIRRCENESEAVEQAFADYMEEHSKKQIRNYMLQFVEGSTDLGQRLATLESFDIPSLSQRISAEAEGRTGLGQRLATLESFEIASLLQRISALETKERERDPNF